MNFTPTDTAPGTPEKIAVFRMRADNGLPLFHPCDRSDYTGFVGGIVANTHRARRAARLASTKVVFGKKALSE